MSSRFSETLTGGRTIRTIASAAALPLPDVDEYFLISGTTTITSIKQARPFPGRRVTFQAASASTAVNFTSTDISTATNGQIYLGTSFLLVRGGSITLRQNPDGVWQEESRCLLA